MLKGDQIKVKCFSSQPGRLMYYLEANSCVDGDQFEREMKDEYLIIQNVNRCIFTGDTISIAGCSTSFEEDTMLEDINQLLTLPDDTKIFCGREQTKTNFEFSILAEPDNPKVNEFHKIYMNDIETGVPPIPSILADEKEYNVFLRAATKEYEMDLYDRTIEASDALHILKEWKNTGNQEQALLKYHRNSVILRNLENEENVNKLVVI